MELSPESDVSLKVWKVGTSREYPYQVPAELPFFAEGTLFQQTFDRVQPSCGLSPSSFASENVFYRYDADKNNVLEVAACAGKVEEAHSSSAFSPPRHLFMLTSQMKSIFMTITVISVTLPCYVCSLGSRH